MSKIGAFIAVVFAAWLAAVFAGVPGSYLVEIENTLTVPGLVAVLIYTAPLALRALHPRPGSANVFCLSIFLFCVGLLLTRGVYSTALRAFRLDWLRDTPLPSFGFLFYVCAPVAFIWAFNKPGQPIVAPRPGWTAPVAAAISFVLMLYFTIAV